MKSASSQYKLVGTIIAIIITAFVFSFYNSPRIAIGSAISGQDYNATTTAGSSVYGSFTSGRLIKKGYGSFGGIVVTGANTGVINVYDATTTDITQRTGGVSTSSILIASYPASLAAGDYTGNDTQLSTGLYVDLVSGTMPTTTVKYR